jgi:enhancing lycopene biosynthesis protein 2
MPNVLMILSGCGVNDGSEIHEAVCTLLHLDRHEAKVTCAAPNVKQMHVVDHLAGQPTDEQRNVLVESARIARGNISDLADVNGADFDAVVLPGGFGAAKNLCTFAVDGADCTVNEDVTRVLRGAADAGKVIGLICISPVIGAKLFGGCTVTIGSDKATASAIARMGSRHETHATTEICIDDEYNIVSTPAYMCAQRIGEVYEGIGRLIDEVMQRVRAGSNAPARASS